MHPLNFDLVSVTCSWFLAREISFVDYLLFLFNGLFRFIFEGVVPGTYHLTASHQVWQISQVSNNSLGAIILTMLK